MKDDEFTYKYNNSYHGPYLGSPTFVQAQIGINFITLVFAVFGIVGNSLTYKIISKDSPNSNKILLQALCVFDNLVLVQQWLTTYFGMDRFFIEMGTPDYANKPVLSLLRPCGIIFRTCLTGCIVLITIHRYVAVVRPFRAGHFCTERKARVHLVVVVVFVLLISLPIWWEHDYYVKTDSDSNVTFIAAERTDMVNDQSYIFLYLIGLESLLMYIIPGLVMIVLNTALIRSLLQAQKRYNKLRLGQLRCTTRYGMNARLTKVIVILVSIFLVLEIPQVVALVIWAKNYRFFVIIQTFTGLCVTLKTSVIFFIYVFSAGKYRLILKQLVFGKGLAYTLNSESCPESNNNNICTMQTSFRLRHF